MAVDTIMVDLSREEVIFSRYIIKLAKTLESFSEGQFENVLDRLQPKLKEHRLGGVLEIEIAEVTALFASLVVASRIARDVKLGRRCRALADRLGRFLQPELVAAVYEESGEPVD